MLLWTWRWFDRQLRSSFPSTVRSHWLSQSTGQTGSSLSLRAYLLVTYYAKMPEIRVPLWHLKLSTCELWDSDSVMEDVCLTTVLYPVHYDVIPSTGEYETNKVENCCCIYRCDHNVYVGDSSQEKDVGVLMNCTCVCLMQLVIARLLNTLAEIPCVTLCKDDV